MPKPTTNETRAMAAESALISFCVTKDNHLIQTVTDETVIGLLTDLQHFCDQHGLVFADLARIAYQHYLEEATQ